MPKSEAAETKLRQLHLAARAAPETAKDRFDTVTTELFRAYAQDVVAIAKKRRVPESRVDDVCSSTWTDVPRSLENFTGDGSFYSWLAGIATNKAFDELRRGKRGQYDQLSGLISKLYPQAPSHERPSRKVARTELNDLVRQILAELDPEDREVLLLRYEEGKSTAEIAAMLGLKPNTVAQRLVRARDRMMKRYAAAERVG